MTSFRAMEVDLRIDHSLREACKIISFLIVSPRLRKVFAPLPAYPRQLHIVKSVTLTTGT